MDIKGIEGAVKGSDMAGTATKIVVASAVAFVGYALGSVLLGVVAKWFPQVGAFGDVAILVMGIVGMYFAWPVAGGILSALMAGMAFSAGSKLVEKFLGPVISDAASSMGLPMATV